MPAKVFWLELARRGRIPVRPRRASNAAPHELDLRMMHRALELADDAAKLQEVPIGAVVYASPGTPAEGRVIAEAHNGRETLRDPAAHAEFVAITAAAKARGDWRLDDCSVAVTLEPCPMCAGLIINARVGRVVFGADDPKAGAVRSLYTLLADRRLNHRPTVLEGVCRDQCAERLSAFFRRLREARRARR